MNDSYEPILLMNQFQTHDVFIWISLTSSLTEHQTKWTMRTFTCELLLSVFSIPVYILVSHNLQQPFFIWSSMTKYYINFILRSFLIHRLFSWDILLLISLKSAWLGQFFKLQLLNIINYVVYFLNKKKFWT